MSRGKGKANQLRQVGVAYQVGRRCAARHRRSCRRRVLVSASLLRQDGLLPSRLRSVGRRVRAGSTTRPATCSSVNKCSRVRTTIAMYASGAAANTPRSARSSCRMCSRRSPASVGRTKFRDAESFRRIADYSSDFSRSALCRRR